MGWSLTQPLALLSAHDFISACTIRPAPQPCAERELFLVRKKSTPVSLMDLIGEACRDCIREDVIPPIADAMPWTTSSLVLVES